jgi:Uma2 family endonuclease
MAVRHAFTVDEWHRMSDVGLFGEDARMELLDGEVIEMAPIGSRHGGCVKYLTRALVEAMGDTAMVAVQDPVVLDERSEPQPDLAALVPRADGYRTSHPSPPEILLVIEVSDTTFAYDRDRKAPYYAGAGVPECWIVDIERDVILLMRQPTLAGYLDVRSLGRGDRVDIEALPDISLAVDDILGPVGFSRT